MTPEEILQEKIKKEPATIEAVIKLVMRLEIELKEIINELETRIKVLEIKTK